MYCIDLLDYQYCFMSFSFFKVTKSCILRNIQRHYCSIDFIVLKEIKLRQTEANKGPMSAFCDISWYWIAACGLYGRTYVALYYLFCSCMCRLVVLYGLFMVLYDLSMDLYGVFIDFYGKMSFLLDLYCLFSLS